MDTIEIKEFHRMYDVTYYIENEVQREDALLTGQMWLERIISEKELNEDQIAEISIRYKNKSQELLVEVGYDKPGKDAFLKMPAHQKIRAVLLNLGYRKKSIKEIKPGTARNSWHIKLHDKPYSKALKKGGNKCFEVERRIINTVSNALEHEYRLFFEFV